MKLPVSRTLVLAGALLFGGCRPVGTTPEEAGDAGERRPDRVSDLVMVGGDPDLASPPSPDLARPMEPDLAVSAPDLAVPESDLAMAGPADMASQLPADLVVRPVDMAMKPADMAMRPPDMAMKPADMAMKPADLVMPPRDMVMQGGNLDRFGVVKLNPTSNGGREWFLPADATKPDGEWQPDTMVTQVSPGVFHVSGAPRMMVVSPAGKAWW